MPVHTLLPKRHGVTSHHVNGYTNLIDRYHELFRKIYDIVSIVKMENCCDDNKMAS